MKLSKLIIGSLLVSALMVGGTNPVLASNDTEVDQEQEQELKVKCETGSYGQTSYCEAEGKQSQRQSVRVLGATHEVADTALDLKTAMAAGALSFSGVGAFALKRKLNS